MNYSLCGVARLYITAAPVEDLADAKDRLHDAFDVSCSGGFDASVRTVTVLDNNQFALEGHAVVDISGDLDQPCSPDRAADLVRDRLSIEDSDGPTGACRAIVDLGAALHTNPEQPHRPQVPSLTSVSLN
jgi:hypothetical protein